MASGCHSCKQLFWEWPVTKEPAALWIVLLGCPLWLWNPEWISPEVWNMGISDPKNGHVSTNLLKKCLINFKMWTWVVWICIWEQRWCYYHLQTKFAKVMFSQVSVCPWGEDTWAWACTPWACIPPGTHPQACMPPGTHIPQVCITWISLSFKVIQKFIWVLETEVLLSF